MIEMNGPHHESNNSDFELEDLKRQMRNAVMVFARSFMVIGTGARRTLGSGHAEP